MPRPRFLSVEETAETLRCSIPTVHRWIKSGALPSVRIGARRLIPEAVIDTLIEKALDPGSRASGDNPPVAFWTVDKVVR